MLLSMLILHSSIWTLKLYILFQFKATAKGVKVSLAQQNTVRSRWVWVVKMLNVKGSTTSRTPSKPINLF